jgi:hypothetical protein
MDFLLSYLPLVFCALFVALKHPGANPIKFVTAAIHERSTLGEAAIRVN